MKKFVLISILFIYLTGTFSVFTACYQSYHQSIFQQAVKNEQEQEVEKLFFTSAQFNSLSWREEGREFEWKDNLYDVNKVEKTVDGYWIYCENDSLEEFLLSILKSVKKEMEGGTTHQITQPQFFHALTEYSFSTASIKNVTTTLVYHLFYKSIESSIPSPPPKAEILLS